MNPYAPVTSTGLFMRTPGPDEAVQPTRMIEQTAEPPESEIRDRRGKREQHAARDPLLDPYQSFRVEIDLGLQGIEHAFQPYAAANDRRPVFVQQVGVLAPIEMVERMALQERGQILPAGYHMLTRRDEAAARAQYAPDFPA